MQSNDFNAEMRRFDSLAAERVAIRVRGGIAPVEHIAFADDADDLRVVDGVVYAGGEVWNALTRRGGV